MNFYLKKKGGWRRKRAKGKNIFSFFITIQHFLAPHLIPSSSPSPTLDDIFPSMLTVSYFRDGWMDMEEFSKCP